MSRRLYVLLSMAVIAVAIAACTMIQQSEQAPADSASDTTTTGAATTDTASGEEAGAANAAADDGELLPPSDPPQSLTYSEWSTDFTRRTVEWSEIRSGGPPKDGIPAIDNPTYESVEEAGEWLNERDPVIMVEYDGVVRAYPLAILTWHEIANETLNGKPVAVTFCPLCNASIVFDREFNGQVLDFGTTGLLRNSDLVMYDRQSETWWQQFTGRGIVGQHAGERLEFLASQVISFGDFAAEYPDATVLARPRDTGSYGRNPYTNYDSSQQPFLFDGTPDSRLPAMERVMGVTVDEIAKAYPFSRLAEESVVNDTVAEIPLVVFHKLGTASALDTSSISEGRDVGSAAIFDRRVEGETLTFSANGDGTFTDEQTGSTWNLLGEATEGELAGTQLEQIVAFDHFWFAWAAFRTETKIYSQ